VTALQLLTYIGAATALQVLLGIRILRPHRRHPKIARHMSFRVISTAIKGSGRGYQSSAMVKASPRNRSVKGRESAAPPSRAR